MILGIDFGNTIAVKRNGVHIGWPLAESSIRQFVEQGITVHIISKVNERQKKEVENWMLSEGFFEETGVPSANLHFCEHRNQKGQIAINLGITHHIDDRPEVMMHMPEEVCKYLFNPEPSEVVKFFNQMQNTMIVNDWEEVVDEIFSEYVQEIHDQTILRDLTLNFDSI
jgi:hypothetical protein